MNPLAALLGGLGTAGKLIATYAVGAVALAAEVTLVDPTTIVGAIGAFVLLASMAWVTVRSLAIKFLREERDAAVRELARARKVTDDQHARMQAEIDEQRELKHRARGELAAEQKLRDLTPILQELTRLQQSHMVRSDREEQMASALDRVAASQSQIAEMLGSQGEMLARISTHLDQLQPPTREGGVT